MESEFNFRNTSVPNEIKFLLPLPPPSEKLYFSQAEGVGMVLKLVVNQFHRRTVHFEFYVVHTPTNALFINLVKSFNLH